MAVSKHHEGQTVASHYVAYPLGTPGTFVCLDNHVCLPGVPFFAY